MYLTEKLLLSYNFKYVILRNINEDVLKKFFGSIRSHDYKNTSPDVSHSITSFKALLINNYMSTHSIGKNSEQNTTKSALDNLKSLLTGDISLVTPLSDTTLESDNNKMLKYIHYRNRKKTRVRDSTVFFVSK